MTQPTLIKPSSEKFAVAFFRLHYKDVSYHTTYYVGTCKEAFPFKSLHLYPLGVCQLIPGRVPLIPVRLSL